jgi:hypothetical protein
MSSLIDHNPMGPPPSSAGGPDDPARRLRAEMAACRVCFTWFGARKSLSPEQKAHAAAAFAAEAPYLSAGKKLLDTAHPAWRAVSAIRSTIIEAWRSMSLPFPEPGVRLLRREQLEAFDSLIAGHRRELLAAVEQLDRHYAELRAAAADRLGDLYNDSDYPSSLAGLFDVSWDYPAIEPPGYLLALSPGLYREEQRRVRQRFEEAVRLAEEAFVAEFGRLVAHLTERLGTEADGSPRVFRDTAVGNLTSFFERFRSLDVRSNAQLDALVSEAQRVVRGIRPQELRDRQDLRRHVAERLSQVREDLDALVVERPRRRVIRGPGPSPSASGSNPSPASAREG